MRLTLAILLLAAAPLTACCMVPLDYKGDVDQAGQRVLVLHRAPHGDVAGYEELMIRVQPFFQNADTTPEYLAWVLTVPSKPLRYDVADQAALDAGADYHQRLMRLASQQWAGRTEFGWPSWLSLPTEHSGNAAAADDIEVGKAVAVGPYTITPVRATGAGAVTELNDYLRERGFPPEDPAHVQYFIDNDFTFLCVKITPPAGEPALGRRLDLPPLVVGFETDRVYYPARFSSRQGNFALDLTIISDKPLDTESITSVRVRLKGLEPGKVQLVNLFSVKPLPSEIASSFGERATKDDPAHWYVNRIESHGFNPTVDGKPAIASWEDDVFLKLGDNTDEVPGFWYYGDAEIGFFDRFFREHALAVFTSVGLFFFISLFIKTRINRRKFAAKTAT